MDIDTEDSSLAGASDSEIGEIAGRPDDLPAADPSSPRPRFVCVPSWIPRQTVKAAPVPGVQVAVDDRRRDCAVSQSQRMQRRQ